MATYGLAMRGRVGLVELRTACGRRFRQEFPPGWSREDLEGPVAGGACCGRKVCWITGAKGVDGGR
jgi:hypothetical protein